MGKKAMIHVAYLQGVQKNNAYLECWALGSGDTVMKRRNMIIVLWENAWGEADIKQIIMVRTVYIKWDNCYKGLTDT